MYETRVSSGGKWRWIFSSAKAKAPRKNAPAPETVFAYEYDFGDSWQHRTEVEQVLPPEPGVRYPWSLAGKRARPPEDVGGIFGYEEFLQAIRDLKHPEREAMLEWVGGAFDPDAFDLRGQRAVGPPGAESVGLTARLEQDGLMRHHGVRREDRLISVWRRRSRDSLLLC